MRKSNNTAIKKTVLPCDEAIMLIRKVGKAKWKKENGYHRRNIAENAMFCVKKIFIGNLKSISFENQDAEVVIKCNVLNKMTSLGMLENHVAV